MPTPRSSRSRTAAAGCRRSGTISATSRSPTSRPSSRRRSASRTDDRVGRPVWAARRGEAGRSRRPAAMLAAMRLRTDIGSRLAAVRELWRAPALRRAQLGWGGFHAAEWASLVALSVVAFEADGAKAVGLVLFARMVPSALVAPFVAVVGDRYRRERILLVVHVVRALACLGAAAALAVDANAIVVYLLAILAAVPLAAHRPSHLALAPLLARTPREL